MKKSILLVVVLFAFLVSCSKDEPLIQYSLSIQITPLEGGNVSPSSNTYNENETVSLLATPLSGFVFKNWGGDQSGNANPITILMNSNKNVSAVFEEIDTDGDGVMDSVDTCPNTPSGETVNSNGCVMSPIYLDSNGITIKCYDWGQIGQTGEVNGIIYTIVSETILRQMVDNGEDITKVCSSKVTDMSDMFRGSTFNQDISSWDVSNVTDMSWMFYQSQFNQDISSWNVSIVTNMSWMFSWTPFNQDISSWDVSNVTNMYWMFKYSQFNQDISSWNVSIVTNMSWMFQDSQFNQDISSWNVSNVTNMSGMFQGSQFNQDISSWNVSNVTNMSGMFYQSQFNQDISSWDVSNVTNMSAMFSGLTENYSSPFNQDISSWDVSNVTDMSWMFKYSQFNQDLSIWNVTNVTSCQAFSEGTVSWTLPKPNFTNCNPNF